MSSHLLLPGLCPVTDAEEETLIEREVLAHALRRSRLQLATLESRSGTFWSRVSSQDAQDDLWMEAQQHVWAEQRGVYEQACLQPLSTCIAELRRWQGVQRAAHERKCAQVKVRSEVEDGNLQWAIFCARLAHDSNGAVGATPLTPEQTRVCDAAVAAQLQPQTRKTRDPRTLSVVRAALVSVSDAKPLSARSTRGLVCSELCQSREQLDRMLSRVIAGVIAHADSPAASAAGVALPSSPAAGSKQLRSSPGRPGSSGTGSGRGATAGTTKADRLNGLAAAAAAGSTASETASLDPRAEAAAAAVLAPAGKRMPLFPRSMRLSSDCLGWLHAHQRSASDRFLYFLVEEMDAPPLPRVRNAHKTAAGITRSLAHRLSTSAEVSAVSIAGADLEVRLPESSGGGVREGDERPALHLRPASVEHLLAVDALWPKMDPADREVLHSCYTPRQTPNASAGRLTTLYVPLSEGPQGEADGVALGAGRRLRPLRQAELMELIRIYVVREPQPAAASLVLPLGNQHDERASEIRAHDDDEVLQHIYCTLAAPGGAASANGQCYVLQMQHSAASSGDAAPPDEAVATPPLIELCQNGALKEAFKATTMQLRKSAVVPPSLTVDQMKGVVAGAQKAASQLADVTAAATLELQGASAPPAPAQRSSSSGSPYRRSSSKVQAV